MVKIVDDINDYNIYNYLYHNIIEVLSSIVYMTMQPTPSLESYYLKDMLEVGVDEAGRGPLFGRVYVGAVILPQDKVFEHSLLRDSKQLSERRRLMAYDYIRDYAIDYAFYWLDETVIDDINIFQATHKCMHKALDQLLVRPEHILVDGNRFYPYQRDHKMIPHTCIEGGDNLYTPIAAASIIAKVEHDRYIQKLCDEHPVLEEYYGLRRNKGYGTLEHRQGIQEHGISPWHRKTFGICKYV